MTDHINIDRRRNVGRRYTDSERLAVVEILVDRHDDDIAEIKSDVKDLVRFVSGARVVGPMVMFVASYAATLLPHFGGH